ncbi:MAG: YjbQ family protein [Spirochaeta sp.]|nr:YjbQ family protein [Spirochaeta sp.]
MVYGESISLATKGFSDIKNITGEVRKIVHSSGIKNGMVNICVIGSTASISTIEFEPALVEDVREKLEVLVSSSMHSRHSETWGDDNGFSHIRATLMGPSITLPVAAQDIILGTWQQVVIIDHDNRARSRKIFIQVMGE